MMPMPTGYEQVMGQSVSSQDAELSFVALLLHRAGEKLSGDIGEEEEGNYYLAAGKYYQASSEELRAIQDSGVPVDEIPVVLHVSRHGGVGSKDVARQRVSGVGWADILSRFCVRPETFYVPLKTGISKAPTKPYRFYRNTARVAWKTRSFSDRDIWNLANLKFAAEFYRIAPDSIVALLSSGWTFAGIHGELQTGILVWDTRTPESNYQRAG